KWLDVVGRDQLHPVPQFGDLPTPMMGAPAGFQSHNTVRLRGQKRQYLASSHLLAEHFVPRAIRPMRLENSLGDIQSDHANLSHGRSSLKWVLTPSLWHIDAVGGRPPHQTIFRMSPAIASGLEQCLWDIGDIVT